MNDYKDIETLLTPRVEAKASACLRARISTIEHKPRRRWWPLGLVASMAVAAMVCGLIFAPATQARVSVKQLIEDAITLLGENFTIEMEVRTTPQENFAHFNPSLAPIPVTMTVNGSEWRIDKGGLVACGNDTLRYEWTPDSQHGLSSAEGLNMIESFRFLINPKAMLESEGAQDETVITQGAGKLILTAKHENETRRYTFDAATHRLTDYRVTVGGVDVVRTTSIVTGNASDCMALPEGIVWQNIDFVSGIGQGQTPEAVAALILSSLQTWSNADILAKAFVYYDQESLRHLYLGSRLVNLGHPFTKPNRPTHIFIPYTLQFPDGHQSGTTLCLTTADDGGWVVDGGI